MPIFSVTFPIVSTKKVQFSSQNPLSFFHACFNAHFLRFWNFTTFVHSPKPHLPGSTSYVQFHFFCPSYLKSLFLIVLNVISLKMLMLSGLPLFRNSQRCVLCSIYSTVSQDDADALGATAVSLDYTQAFDTISLRKHMNELNSCNFSQNFVSWVSFY